MSVYSGFGTRVMENQYNSLLSLLILTLSKRLVKFYKQENCNEKAFKGVFYRIVGGMKILENNKYVPPKFSENLKSLYDILQLNDHEKLIPNKLMASNGFDELNKQTNLVLNQQGINEKQLIQNVSQENQRFNGMPPHPLKNIKINQSSDQQSQHETSIDQNQYNQIALQSQNQNQYSDQQVQANLSEESENKVYIKTREIQRRKEKDHTLPSIDQQQNQNMVISPEMIQQISRNVEQQILEKYMIQNGKNKKKVKSKTKKKMQVPFRQLLLEFEKDNKEQLSKTFYQQGQPQQNLYQEQNENGMKQFWQNFNGEKNRLHPLSEGNRTRPKFYSVNK